MLDKGAKEEDEEEVFEEQTASSIAGRRRLAGEEPPTADATSLSCDAGAFSISSAQPELKRRPWRAHCVDTLHP